MKYLFISIFLMMTGCGGDSSMPEKASLPSIGDISSSTWERLSQKTIYFGHQSVGNNIIGGMSNVIENSDLIKVNIKETNNVQMLDVPVFAHSDIGKNDDIDLKFSDFSKKIRNGLGEKVDIAFLKLCFWDVRRHTDVEAVFSNYKKTMESLKAEYPQITFVHFTVPLMSRSKGLMANIKRMIRHDNGDLDNIKRNELNLLIRKEYGNKGHLFDIALFESTLPSGERAIFTKDGTRYQYLAGEYTDDGGHLNEQASKYVAEQLLITLAKIVEKD